MPKNGKNYVIVPLTPADQGKEPGSGKTVVPVPGISRENLIAWELSDN